MTENALLENIDRTVFTFNMHNLSEMCFNKVFKKNSIVNGDLSKEHQKQIDLCVLKYMQAFKIVQKVTHEELQ